MYALFSSLANILKFQTVTIDNNVFRLHYRLTLLILVAFSLVTTLRQYLGDPIDCIHGSGLRENVLDTFCWIHSTFSVEEAWKKSVGNEVIYPGVDKHVEGKTTKTYHAYYQWVCFVLFLQAALFYIPRYLWKSSEGGKIKSMVQDLKNPVIDPEKKEASIDLLVTYMIANFNNNDNYARLYFATEVLNAINVIGQMYLMDKFLGGTFSSYGMDVIKFTEWDSGVRYDPMIRVFPRITKCTFRNYGSSGDLQKYDALCILPINIMNEKIYVFLWFWFVFMAVLSCLAVAYRLVLFASQEARIRCLKLRSTLVKKEHVKIVVQKCRVGDWFVVHLLSKNLNPVNFKDFMDQFSKQLDGKSYDYSDTLKIQ